MGLVWMEKKKEPGKGGDQGWSQHKKEKKQVRGTHPLISNHPGHRKKRRGGLQLVSTQGKRASMGTHQWNASGDVALGMAAVMAAVREKCKWSVHQEKASK